MERKGREKKDDRVKDAKGKTGQIAWIVRDSWGQLLEMAIDWDASFEQERISWPRDKERMESLTVL